jgi:hypothetical protein
MQRPVEPGLVLRMVFNVRSIDITIVEIVVTVHLKMGVKHAVASVLEVAHNVQF